MVAKKIKQIVDAVAGVGKPTSVVADLMRQADNLKAITKADEAAKIGDAIKSADAAKTAEALRQAAKAADPMSMARYNYKIKDISDEAAEWFARKIGGDIKVQRGAVTTVSDTRKALDIPSTEAVPLPGLTGKTFDAFRAPTKLNEEAIAAATKKLEVARQADTLGPFTPEALAAKEQAIKAAEDELRAAYSLSQTQELTTKESVYNLLNQPIEASRFGTPEDYRRMDYLEKNPEFQKLFSEGDDMFNKGARILDINHNTQFEEMMYKPARYPHQRSKAFADFRKNFPQTPALDKTGLKGNTSAFTTREFPGGVLDANYAMEAIIQDMMDRGILKEENIKWLNENGIPNLFEVGLNDSIAKMIKEGPALGKQMMVMDEVMIKYMLTDQQFIREFTEVGGKVPYGFSVIPKSQLVNKIQNMAFYAHDKSGYLAGVDMLDNMAGNLLVNDHVMDLLAIMEKPRTADLMLTIYDEFNKMFKTAKLMTFGNLWRNFSGNLLNVTLSGVPVNKWASIRPKAYETLKDFVNKNGKPNGKDLIRRAVVEGTAGWSQADLDELNLIKDFIKDGLYDMSYGTLDIPDNMLEAMGKDPASRTKFQELISFFGNKNYEEDLLQRMTVYIYARENPQTYLRLGLMTPADFVRYSLFDPNDLTKFEKDVMRRFIPFYVWAKKNIVYHMKNFPQNPNAYYRVAKGYDAMWEAFDINPNTDIEEYKRANMWIPIFVQKDGKYVAIKMNTPIGDFGEFISNPFAKILASTSPGIRAPFELTTNTQILTGLPIEEFPGQKGYNLEFLPRRADYLVSQTGLDVPIGGFTRAYQAATGLATGKMEVGEAIIKSPLRSVLSEGDVAKARRNYDYQKLDRIRQTMRFYKQEGIDIPTIADIENQEKNNAHNRLRMRLMKYK